MKIDVSSDNTVTIVADFKELGILDYGLGYFQQHTFPQSDYDTASEIEKQLWDVWSRIDHGFSDRHPEA